MHPALPGEVHQVFDRPGQIVSDECILCGQCFVVCPQNAKEIRNDVPSAMELIKSGPVIASLAPSFVANYPGATAAPWRRP